MKFTIDQSVGVAPAVAAAAYGNPAFYEGRAPRDNIAVLEVVSHQVDGPRTVIEVRFKFNGSVSGAVRRVIDPAKMSWVTRTEVLTDECRTQWKVLPDHYPDRLSASGTYTFTAGSADPSTSTIRVAGDLKVHVPLVGGTVERVIVSGLRNYIAAEVESLPDVQLG